MLPMEPNGVALSLMVVVTWYSPGMMGMAGMAKEY